MTNCDASIEAVKYKEDFVNNRISRDLKKHNWLVEKLLQEKLIEKIDNVSSTTKSQKKLENKQIPNVSKPPKFKSKNVSKKKKEELTLEQCLKPLRSKLKEDKKQSLNICIDIAKVIYKKLLRNHKYIKKRKNHEKNTEKTKLEKKTTDKPSLGTVDDLFNNIKVFELNDKNNCYENKNPETDKSKVKCKSTENKDKTDSKLNRCITKDRSSRAIDINNMKIDKNYIKRKINKLKRNDKAKINTINITVGDRLTCHLPTFGNIDTSVSRKNEFPNITERMKLHDNEIAKKEALETPVNCNAFFKCDVSKDSTKEKKCKTYSVQAQTESVSIMTKEEHEMLDFLKSKKLDKISLDILLQQPPREPISVIIKEEDKRSCNGINNPSELLQSFLTFCDEYKKKTDELSEKISALFASIKEKETIEISNLAEAIEKELENMTRESHSLNQVLDQMMETNQNNISTHQIPETPITISELPQEQNTEQNRDINHQSPQQQNLNQQHQANMLQHNFNPQIQVQNQQNLIFQHQTSTSTEYQTLNGQSEVLNPQFQHLQSSQQTQIPQQIQQPNCITQQSLQRLQTCQFQYQPSYQQNWLQVKQIEQINQYPYRKQNLEPTSRMASAMNTNWLHCQPVAASRQPPAQARSSTQSSHFPLQLMHHLQRPNIILPQDQNWRVNRPVF